MNAHTSIIIEKNIILISCCLRLLTNAKQNNKNKNSDVLVLIAIVETVTVIYLLSRSDI
jgi:EamA domain-containing membrane protein RarD